MMQMLRSARDSSINDLRDFSFASTHQDCQRYGKVAVKQYYLLSVCASKCERCARVKYYFARSLYLAAAGERVLAAGYCKSGEFSCAN